MASARIELSRTYTGPNGQTIASLRIQYADKEAHVEIQVAKPLYDREPLEEICWRELKGLTAAIDGLVLSETRIFRLTI
jgi:hypothetical protein